jgi:hypothetical protein
MPVTVADIRPLTGSVPGLTFLRTDATSLAEIETGSVVSLSSLHAVEHFGLGRYGDPVDPDAWRKGAEALSRVLAPGGCLYLSVPIGRQRVDFNAQRVFSPGTVLRAFGALTLHSFAAVDDDGTFVDSADPQAFGDAWNACGLFELVKPERAV